MTTTQHMLRRIALATLALVVFAPMTARAQGNASAAAAGMGDNYTALARNFNAPAWNPANLGLEGNSRFSIALSPQFGLGTGPLTFKDLKDYGGVVVPAGVREQWLQKIAENGSQSIGGDINITPVALSIGRLAFSATTTIRANGELPEAVAELLLFGNAGRTGSPADFALNNAALDANATSTFALSYGKRLGIMPMGDFAIGVTGKYIVGHGLASMRDNGSTITSNPVEVTLDLPVVMTDTSSLNAGSGMGFDLGASWKVGRLTMSATAKDVVNTFAWDTDNLYYIPATAQINQDSSVTQIDSILPLSAAPQGLQDVLTQRIEDATIKPSLALGVAWKGSDRLTLTADLRQRFGTGIQLGPETQIGVGAQLNLIPFVPLRAGVTSLSGGMRYSGGLGLEFGVFNLQAAASLLDINGRNDTTFGLTMSFGGR